MGNKKEYVVISDGDVIYTGSIRTAEIVYKILKSYNEYLVSSKSVDPVKIPVILLAFK